MLPFKGEQCPQNAHLSAEISTQRERETDGFVSTGVLLSGPVLRGRDPGGSALQTGCERECWKSGRGKLGQGDPKPHKDDLEGGLNHTERRDATALLPEYVVEAQPE